MIKNVIFDIGNVLLDFCWKDHIARFGFQGEKADRIAQAMMLGPIWPKLDLGLESDEDILEQFVAHTPELEQEIRKGGFLGLKSYLSLSPKYLPEAEIRIFDFFPKAQLKKMDELGAIVMLHIPRNGRLKDPVNLAQIMEIKQEFPNIRLIIAHIGRAYTKEDVGNAFETLDQAPDLMYDFCANCCEYAITEVIRHAGVKHVMYGTDMPILRMRTHRIEENGTYINLVPPGLYGDPKQDKHLREVSAEEAEKITFFLYEELLAFKRACKTLGLTKQDVEDIMYNNAHDLIEGARKSIYG